MLVLPYCKKYCSDKIPVQLGDRLGDGADGEVFSIIGDEKKVFKLGIIYNRPGIQIENQFNKIENVLKYFVDHYMDAYARVYEYGYLGSYSSEMKHWSGGVQKFIIYYYIMERLHKISDDESKVFHSLLSHEDRGIEKNFSLQKIKKMLQGMKRGLDFKEDKVMLFCENIRQAPVCHLDIHVRNIMKDNLGNFKLIDLDRVKLEKNNV